ncbi:chemotaxis protein CheA [Geoalkalibacter halelectricus]|uniref:Chemotaxis protein CheA n=1 Tax=Geoalkalibacter halelectricus TaxID=2847045 RepID=A0ABY5ZIH7_9BACT|nr:chemotaxis protein CheA [Geoalkalibacter halelectricus]MDO3378086.1 chemotaxis protein CheA [Geoalkalibacter halelectricus]UWZ78383.1 chemotaxis protein CheA [Geoalkalibacter halelectricus]
MVSDDQIEIIQEFVQESRDMIDQLEPTIIELGQSVHDVQCWETLGCTDTQCSRHGHPSDFPCWLEMGHIAEGSGRCIYTESKQDCLNCRVFQSINGDGKTMNAIFRLFHSMKGSAGFLEFDDITRVAHTAENLLDLIRNGGIRMQPAHVNLLCASCDFAKAALDQVEEHFSDQGMREAAEDISARLDQAIEEARTLARGPAAEAASPAPVAAPPVDAPPEQTLEIDTAEEPAFVLEISGEMLEKFVQEGDELLQNVEQDLLKWEEIRENPTIIASLFRNVHSFKGNCGFFGVADMERLSHQMETLLDAVKSGRDFGLRPGEVMLGLIDVLREALGDLARGGSGRIANLDAYLRQLADILAEETPAAAVEEVPQAVNCVAPIAEAPEPPQAAAPILAKPAPVRTEAKPKPVENKPAATASQAPLKRQDIRVDLEKLDNLINLIGEIVIAENMLVRNPDLDGLELENFNKAGQHMSKLVRELQETAMIIRMIPVSGLFRRMIRLVHDISLKAGKKVDLRLSGEETEMDKTVIETITDPLVHILRNSCDHGIEPPAERLKAGKPEKGVVKLSACHEEGEVWITIEDDGRGLDRDKLLAKAISKGLVEGDGSDMSDKAVYNLIFAPGFSTAEKITDISGRGVGMDVVRQNLDKIKGRVDVHSRKGQGTRITLRIPLTLAIIDGMLVRVGQTKAIVPTLAIREAFRPQADAVTHTPDGDHLVRVRERFLPVVRLHEILRKEPDSHQIEDGILIVLENQDASICLLVDEILGQQQTVIKGLSDYIGSVRAVSGCTIMGNGEVCLILDIGSLMEISQGESLGSN